MRAAGVVWGRRKSIAGSEYIQRRSAVRVWKFETAFLARVLSETWGNPHATTICRRREKCKRRMRRWKKGGGYARRSCQGKRDVNLTDCDCHLRHTLFPIAPLYTSQRVQLQFKFSYSRASKVSSKMRETTKRRVFILQALFNLKLRIELHITRVLKI